MDTISGLGIHSIHQEGNVMIEMTKNSPQKIQTLNATGAGGVNIDRQKYDAMKKALLKVITARKEGTAFQALPSLVKPLLPGLGFPAKASVGWYVTVVKLDLEARGLIERVARIKPQRLRRVKQS